MKSLNKMKKASVWILSCLAFTVLATAVSAQDIDWLVNVDETVTPAPAGGLLEIPVTVTNNGFDPAGATTIDIVVPADTTFESFSGTILNCSPIPAPGGATVTCDVPALASSETADMLFGIRTTTAGSPAMVATVPLVNGLGEVDINIVNNNQSKNLTLTAGAEVELTVAAPTSAASGEIIDYVFTATNNGPNDATDLEFTFEQPSGLANFVAPAGCTLGGSIYTCVIAGPLAVGESTDLSFEAQVVAVGGSSVTALAEVGGGTPDDPDVDNNSVTPELTVTSGSDLAMEKSVAGSSPLLVGDTTAFTLSPSFTGEVPTGLTITDTVPSNYVIQSVIPAPGSGWTCGFDAGSGAVSCTNPGGVGTPGSDQPLGDITIEVLIDNEGLAENFATIASSDQPDPNAFNDTGGDGGVVIEEPFIDLDVSKTGIAPALFVVGQEYDFSLSATNDGNTDYTGTIVLTDIVPAGLTVTSVAGWACAPVPLIGDGVTELVCTRDFSGADALGPTETTPAAVVTVEVTAPGTFTNTAVVSTGPDANLPDENPGNDTATYGGTGAIADDSADVTVAKSAAVPSVVAGELQTFDIEIINLGPDTATDVRMRDSILSLINELDSGPNPGFVSIAYDNISAADANCSTSPIGDNGRELACTIASLDVCVPGDTCPIITVEVRPGGEAGGRSNTATAVSFGTPDTNRGNNSSTAPYAVEARADITVEKAVSATDAEAGQLLTYVINGINKDDGLSSAENMIISDVLPDDLTFLSATASVGTCGTQPDPGSVTSPTNNLIECAIGDVPNGVQQTVTVQVRPNFELIGDTITNSASVSTDTTEVGVGDETASVDVTISPASLDLLIQKTDSIDPVAFDEETVYSVTVRNLGPSATQNIVVEDILPPSNLTILSVDDGDGDVGVDSCTPAIPAGGQIGGTLTCNYAYLPAGESIVILVTAEGQSKGSAENRASVESSETLAGYDTNLTNNEVVETTTVRTRSDVEITSKTATPASVSQRDLFNFIIRATVNVGPGLVEADDVEVIDSLPAGMELTGTPTVSVVQGSVTGATCTGVATETDFVCDLGTFSPDFSGPSDLAGIVDITVPVRVITVASDPQTFTNSAEITTSSLDADPDNNMGSGDVIVNSSTLSGTLFRDFNEDGTAAATDTGVGGVTITLSGETPDGLTFTRTTTTAADGSYSFGLLPEGTYDISRGTVAEDYQDDGDSYPDGGNGTSTSATLIEGVVLGDDATAGNNDFTVVPIARIGLAKAAPLTTVNQNGSFDQFFRLRVENFSLEALENIAVTDVLEGAAPSFGTYTSGTPAPGEYTMLIAPSSNCGGGAANLAFNGATDTVVASGITLAAGAICRIDFNISVQPTNPLPPFISGTDRYSNSATVTGEGVLSGQTSATNPLLSDISNNGGNPDPNSNGVGNDAGEDDPTLVGPIFAPAIAIIKEADTSAFSSPPAPLDTVTYTFTVTNTGNLDLFDVEIEDPLPGLVLTDPVIGDLAVDEVVTRTATYQISQDDIDAGEVENTATATGEDIYGTEVDDTSGATNATGDDGPIITPILQVPSVQIIKVTTGNSVQDPTVPGDEITYAFSVRNDGNVTLTDVTVTDPLPGIVLSGTPIPEMAPGDEVPNAYTATYEVRPSDINTGEVRNQATATGTDPNDDPTTDLSGPTYDADAPVVVPLSQDPSIALIKTATTGRLGTPPQEGDFIDYQFTVTNTGNVTLTDISITDLLPGIVLSGGPITLDAGEVDSTTFTAEYAITQDNLNLGEVENLATVTGTPPFGPDVEDDSGADNATDAPLVTPLDQVSSIGLVKTADVSDLSSPPEDGEVVTYRFAVTNTGNQTLTDVTLVENLIGATVLGGPIDTLEPGETDTTSFTATYPLDQDDIDLGSVTNQATTTGQDPSDADVSDDSGATNGDDDPTVTTFDQVPGIAIIKTADTSGLSSPPVAGETITYSFSILNTGNVRLTDVSVTDPLPGLVLDGDPIPVLQPGEEDLTTYSATYMIDQDDINTGEVENRATVTGTDPSDVEIDDLSGDTYADDNPIVVPLAQEPSIAVIKTSDASLVNDPAVVDDQISYSFTITNTGNVTLTNIRLTDDLPGIMLDGDPIASLEPSEVDATTFTATYTISQDDIDAGQVLNRATVTATPPVGDDIDDLSGSANDNDDPTIEPLSQNPAITLDKIADGSAFEDGSVAGESALYSFVITNTGNVTLTDVTVTDALAGVVLSGGPILSLAPGEIDSTTYTAEYVVDDDDIARGTVVNDATVTGTYFDQVTGADATVDDSDSETVNVANVEANPEPFPPFATDGGVTTSVLESDRFRGGPATLTNVTIEVLASDPEITLDPATGLITMPPGTPAGSYEVTYEICSIDFPDICDTTTETVVQLPLPSIETTKTQEVIDNGDGIEGVGDTVRYTITVENTGNVPVTGLVLDDTFTAIDGSPLTLTMPPDFDISDADSLEGDLLIDETATYFASFVLDVNAVTRGGLENTVLATALPVFPADVPGTPTEIDDRSDDGIDDDGDVASDPTILLLSPSLAFNPDLTLSKTTTADIVTRGQTVPYTITIRNDSVNAVGPLDIVDSLPSGLLYVAESATYEGSPADVSVSGRVVTWDDVVVPPLTTVTATLSAVVLSGANSGDLVNVVNLIDPATGGRITAPANAAVRLQPEPIFDCGEVIGKVFDDRNGNGYQDEAVDPSYVVSDQTYTAGKVGDAAITPNPGEPGIPAVRLATVDGTVITTDAHGRYSVPCAALPADSGGNFILKLDTASLPSGYRLTTENPRVMTLTPGKMIEMNFGVSISRLVRVDLNANGFVLNDSGRLTLAPALVQGIRQLLPQIADTPAHLRLAFHINADADSAEVARARQLMEAVEDYIDEVWQDVGQVKLTTERTIVRSGQ